MTRPLSRLVLGLALAALLGSPFGACALAQEPAPASAPASQPAPPDAAQLRARGAELARQGRREDSLAAYREAYEADRSFESLMGLHGALLADERVNDAFRLLERADEPATKRVDYHAAFARTFVARAEKDRAEGADAISIAALYEEAARSLQDALEIDPERIDLRVACVQDLLLATKTEEARDVAQDARRRAPGSWEAALALGDACYHHLAALGRLRPASVVGEGEDIVAARAVRTELVDEALAAYRAAAKLAADRGEPHGRIGGFVLAIEGDKAEALAAFTEALARNPSQVSPAAAIAGMSPKEMLGFFEKALAEYGRRHPGVAPDDPTDASLHWYLGYARLLGGDTKGAGAAYETAVRKNPSDPSARYYLGKIAYNEQRFEDAVRHFDTLARKSPRTLGEVGASDSFFYATMQGLVGRLVAGDSGAPVTDVVGNASLDVAIRFTEAILAVHPTSVEDWNNLGLFQRDADRPKEALAAYKKALDIDPLRPSLLNDTAVIYHYYLRSNDSEAAKLYELAIERANQVIADREASSGQKEEAKVALRDATTNLARLRAGNRRND